MATCHRLPTLAATRPAPRSPRHPSCRAALTSCCNTLAAVQRRPTPRPFTSYHTCAGVAFQRMSGSHSAGQSSANRTHVTHSMTRGAGLPTLQEFVTNETRSNKSLIPEEDASALLGAFDAATRYLADKISRASIENLTGMYDASGLVTAAGDKQKKLDVVANEVLKDLLVKTGKVAVVASEEEDDVVVTGTGSYVAVFDPLDGSRNIDASIPTGTILGVYKLPPDLIGQQISPEAALSAALQPGSQLVAAAYSVYSSATTLVWTLGHGAHGFTLDNRTGDFLLTHENIRIPARGQIYSLNDARYFDWPSGLRDYIDTIRQGKGQSPKQYSARYICCLVADFHRTLLYGGWAANPRPHLRLVYEANPLSFLCEQAGGKGSDGKRRLMSITPSKLHQKLPVFLGSPEDINELESYDNVQQVSGSYEV